MARTSKADFEKFKKSFRKYQELLGIQNFEILFEHEKLEDNDAELIYYRQPCAAIVKLNIDKSTPRTMDTLAKHEAIELLLSRARVAAMKRNVSDDDIDEIFHSVVQCLMRVIP